MNLKRRWAWNSAFIAIGLAHTDQTFGTIITGTPATDAASVMNSGSTYGGCPPAAPSWSAFSYYDQLAARTLYPLRAPAPSVTNSGGTPLIHTRRGAGYLLAADEEDRGVTGTRSGGRRDEEHHP